MKPGHAAWLRRADKTSSRPCSATWLLMLSPQLVTIPPRARKARGTISSMASMAASWLMMLAQSIEYWWIFIIASISSAGPHA